MIVGIFVVSYIDWIVPIYETQQRTATYKNVYEFNHHGLVSYCSRDSKLGRMGIKIISYGHH